MNTLFGDMAKRVAQFNPEKEAIIATKSAKDEIIDFNVEDQLYEEGINNKGQSLGEYQPYTKEKKQIKSAAGVGDGKISNVTLRDEGRFHRSFKVKYSKDRFELTATDKKTEKLKKHWGDDIFGLTDENLKKLIDNDIRPSMQAAFRAKILT